MLVACAGGGFGDSLLASVVGRALRSRFSRVEALTLPPHVEALQRVPDFDAVLADDARERELADRLASRDYAAVVVTWATARIANVVKRAGIPIRVGQARRLYSGLFTKRVVVRSERRDVTSHWTSILLDYARALDCDTIDTEPRFRPTEADEMEAYAVMARHKLERNGFFVLHPSNAIASSRPWPVGGWRALAIALQERLGGKVVVTGSPAEAKIAQQVGGDAIPVAGETSLGAFGALVAQARAFVGITTGSMHVAAAVGAPTVGIFPFQSDFPERWAPLGRRTAVVRASYACHAGDTKERCTDYACIRHLDVERIIAATESLLK